MMSNPFHIFIPIHLGHSLQVLSDPQQRLVYDVYGKQGLAAGLQVGPKLRGREEIKAEWERFQAQRVRRSLQSRVYGLGFKHTKGTLMTHYVTDDVYGMQESHMIHMGVRTT